METKNNNKELIKENIKEQFNLTEFDLELQKKEEEIFEEWDDVFRRLADS